MIFFLICKKIDHYYFVDNKFFIIMYIEFWLSSLVEHEMGIFFIKII